MIPNWMAELLIWFLHSFPRDFPYFLDFVLSSHWQPYGYGSPHAALFDFAWSSRAAGAAFYSRMWRQGGFLLLPAREKQNRRVHRPGKYQY